MVKIQRYETTNNDFGGSTQDWVDKFEGEGVIDMLSGNEVLAADTLGRASSHILILFTIIDVKRGDRVIHNNDRYRVTYVDNPMNLNRHLEISLIWEASL
ncbi:phage head closure protein [Alkalihalophilus marmarensis]|uniref:phage head closure protein n=1 Tax=Alkalihalophilus marmarensis TaxID=521377 RepID=UPI002DB71AF8|nr:phage head closure protein [Alkalihalophilus marmarensis]MEC2070338.1 phage head closure protein [Alkalihalophilus marmarensis]